MTNSDVISCSLRISSVGERESECVPVVFDNTFLEVLNDFSRLVLKMSHLVLDSLWSVLPFQLSCMLFLTLDSSGEACM